MGLDGCFTEVLYWTSEILSSAIFQITMDQDSFWKSTIHDFFRRFAKPRIHTQIVKHLSTRIEKIQKHNYIPV